MSFPIKTWWIFPVRTLFVYQKVYRSWYGYHNVSWVNPLFLWPFFNSYVEKWWIFNQSYVRDFPCFMGKSTKKMPFSIGFGQRLPEAKPFHYQHFMLDFIAKVLGSVIHTSVVCRLVQCRIIDESKVTSSDLKWDMYIYIYIYICMNMVYCIYIYMYIICKYLYNHII